MGEVRPPRLWFLPVFPLLPPSPCLVLSWGGGAPQVLGVAPHLLYHTPHEGCAQLLGGFPPLSFGIGGFPPPPPPFPACCALGAHTVRGVSPSLVAFSGPSPSLSCMHCAGRACCSGGPPVEFLGFVPPPLSSMSCAGSARCSGGCPLLLLLHWRATSRRLGMSCTGSARFCLGCPLLRQGLACALWVHAVCPLPPPARVRFARAVGSGGPPLVPNPCHAGVPVLMCLRVPHVPSLHTVGACCWVGGALPLSPLGGRSR